ncbi:MAG: PadR family transcriptional regulator [Brevinematales bacterium]|jgi:DNA-binding PadR family transcriptional regulator
MVTDIVILALLSNKPKHGYEIKKDVSRILERETKLNNNLLYPALRRLEKTGAVVSELQEQAETPTRRVYSITPAGREMFKNLLNSFREEDISKEEEFLVRVAFMEKLGEHERLRLLDMRLKELQRRLDHHNNIDGSFAYKFDSPWIENVMSYRQIKITEDIAWIEELKSSIVKY